LGHEWLPAGLGLLVGRRHEQQVRCRGELLLLLVLVLLPPRLLQEREWVQLRLSLALRRQPRLPYPCGVCCGEGDRGALILGRQSERVL